MSTRITDEERIVNFFQNGDPKKAETLLNVIKGIMRSRTPEAGANKRTKTKRAPRPQTSRPAAPESISKAV